MHAVDRAALEVLELRRHVRIRLGPRRQRQRRHGARGERGASHEFQSRTTICFHHVELPPSYWMTMTTRRLRASFVWSPVSTSRPDSPLVNVETASDGTPFLTRPAFTTLARAWPSCWFICGEPTVSV